MSAHFFWKIIFIIFLIKHQSFADTTIEETVEECIILFDETLPRPQPLFVKPGTDIFLPPTEENRITLKKGEQIELICTRSFKVFKLKHFVATCTGGDVFTFNGTAYQFREFECISPAEHIAKRSGRKCNHDKAIVVDVGFDIGDRFLRLYEVCHNERTFNTYYVHHKITPANVRYERSVGRQKFIEKGFYNGKRIDRMYGKKRQQELISSILGDEHEKYINYSQSLYLSRGHMVAKSEMIYRPQQHATFYLINTAPQWQRFNGGNWQQVETGVKNFVAKNNIEIDCYTGTYGIMELPDVNGENQKLHLHIDENDERKVPIPKIFFKLLYHTESKRGIVLIGINNPHLTENQLQDYIICDDLSHNIDWIKWNKNNIQMGYSYACTIEDFTKVVDYFPPFDVKGTLY